MIKVFETFDLVQADILKTQLEDVGVMANILTSDIGGVRPSLSFVEPIRIMVHEHQLAEAVKVIKDLGF
jgi:hypothetical protein